MVSNKIRLWMLSYRSSRRQMSSAMSGYKILKWKDYCRYRECHEQQNRLTTGYWRKQGSPQHSWQTRNSAAPDKPRDAFVQMQ